MTTSQGLQRITKSYSTDVMEFPRVTKRQWLEAIREDFEMACSEPLPSLVNRDNWLIHVAAMIARYVELPEESQ